MAKQYNSESQKLNRSIRIIRPSGSGGEHLLLARISDLESRGFNISYSKIASISAWDYSSNSIALRALELENALLEPGTDIIIAARGGYGASDLLPVLNWDKIEGAPSKILLGFSDITAIHSAIWSKLKRGGIHGPMPGSQLWGKSTQMDIDFLLDLLEGRKKEGSIVATAISPCPNFSSGWLFGGCMSVLCNLIGTPYFPDDLKDAILFLEDTGENPGQILRHWNQLVQNDSIAKVSAIVLGDLGGELDRSTQFEIKSHLAHTSKVPVYSSQDFGHVSPNWSLPIGSPTIIDSKDSILKWTSSI